MTGTNFLTLTATDSAGNVAATNITVFPGAVALTITTPDSSQLWNQGITVNGTISDSADYTVWVNGVKASYTDGTDWTATNVYLPEGGTALIQARAIPNSDNGGNGTGGGGGDASYDNPGNPASAQAEDAESQTDRQPRLYLASYDDNEKLVWAEENWDYYDLSGTHYWNYGNATYNYTENYADGASGGNDMNSTTEGSWHLPGIPDGNANREDWSESSWPASSYPDDIMVTYIDSDGDYGENDPEPPSFNWESCDIGVPDADDSRQVNDFDGTYNTYVYIKETGNRHAHAVIKLQTGGKGNSQRQNLFCFNASAAQMHCINYADYLRGFDMAYSTPIPAQNITVDNKPVGADGKAWLAYADNTTHTVTPKVTGLDWYKFTISLLQKYHPYITANGYDLDTNTPEFCVGQNVTFQLNGLPSANLVGNWNLPGEFVNQQTNYSATCTTYVLNGDLLKNTPTTSCWFINKPGGKVSVGMNLLFSNGQSVSVAADGSISVVKPQAKISPVTTSVNIVDGRLAFESLDEDNGITFFHTITIPAGFSGSVQWEQIVTANSCNYQDTNGTWHVLTTMAPVHTRTPRFHTLLLMTTVIPLTAPVKRCFLAICGLMSQIVLKCG